MSSGSGKASQETPIPRVVDTSALIVLAKIGRLDLLTAEGRAVWIVDTVAWEVAAGNAQDPARQALAEGFGLRAPDVAVSSALAEWRLDAGEEATIALAQDRGYTCVLDDGDGRRAARALGLIHTGTIGLVTEGKRLGLLASAADTLRDLRDADLYLPDDARMNALLQTVGETWP